MKPLLLEIEGLNSFQEKQVINFEELIKYGFFGIFGKTGSGKSTILDAIVLALYGIIPRNSKEFINSSSQKTVVNYTFMIGKNKYRIEREFKRNKTLSHKCSIKDLNKETTIAENVSEAKNVIEDIIGLNSKDFLRCVVLPQGKFSELLTQTKSSERAEMLQRIFVLEKYGDKLYSKLSDKKKDLINKITDLNGQLKTYEEISEEKLKLLENEYVEKSEKLENTQKELNKTSIIFEEYQKLWNSKLKLLEEEKKLDELLKNKDKIKSYELKINLSKKATNIIPHILEYETLQTKFIEKRETLNKLEEEVTKKEKEFEELNKKYKIALNVKEKNYEPLIKYIEKLKDGLTLTEKNEKNIQKKATLENELNELTKNLKKLSNGIKDIDNKIDNSSKILNTSIQKKESIKKIINPEIKEKILKLLEIDKEIKALNTDLTNNQAKKEELKTTLIENEELIKKLKKANESMELEISNIEEEKKLLQNKINHEDVQNLYVSLNNLENKIKNLQEKQTTLHNLQKDLKNLEDKKNDYSLLKNSILNSMEENEITLNKINEIHKKNLYAKIARELKENEPCPVCGSIHHDNPAKFEKDIEVNINDEERIKNTIKELTLKKETILKDETTLNTKIDLIKNNIKELNDFFKQIKVKDLENKYKELDVLYKNKKIANEQNESKIKKLEVELKNKNEEFINLNKKLSSTNQNLENLKNKVAEQNELIEKIKLNLKNKATEYKLINQTLTIKDPYKKFEEIKELENNYKILEETIETLNKNIFQEKETKDKLMKKINTLNIKKAELNSNFITLNNEIENITSKINLITSNPSLTEELNNTKIKLKEIIENEKTLKEEKENKFNLLNTLKTQLSSTNSTLKNISLQIENKEKFLNSLLKETTFGDKNDVKNYYLEKDEINLLETTVEDYKNKFNIINNNLKTLKKELNGKSITENGYQEIKLKKNTLNVLLETLKNEEFLLKNTIKEIKEKLKTKKSLSNTLKKYNNKKDIYDELSKLFEGKKFVKFISSMQMNHIIRDASQRLKSITNERYALEIDSESNFIIRDDGNGGIRRDPKSLSGGETFLASLSLALALSSQIQLKGKIPLEFFFLDEGFGTLDNELLDTVMNSLEKLRNEKLSVGIISHINELKDRVPTKLLITSANPGTHGSKVKIEHS